MKFVMLTHYFHSPILVPLKNLVPFFSQSNVSDFVTQFWFSEIFCHLRRVRKYGANDSLTLWQQVFMVVKRCLVVFARVRVKPTKLRTLLHAVSLLSPSVLRLSGKTATFFFSRIECLQLFMLSCLICGHHLMTAVVTKCSQPWCPRFTAPCDVTHTNLRHYEPRQCIALGVICPACAWRS